MRVRRSFDKISYRWLDQNYKRIYGLRNWTWRTIIEGIIVEHKKLIKAEGSKSEIDLAYVSLIWYTILELSGIKNLDTIPKLTDPESIDVKVILNFYSLESFLFKKLNRSSREQDISVISTIGPFAVALN